MQIDLIQAKILEQLPNFTGTEHWYQYSPSLFPGVLLTDGTKFIADECGAYWLMDAISSYLSDIQTKDHFTVVMLKRTGNQAVLTLADDEPANVVHARQEIHFTDFPLEEFKVYAIYDGEHWVILLPSEY